MKAELKTIDGVESLVLTMPIQPAKLSTSGKSLVIAGSNGTKKTECIVKGKAVSLTVTAWIKPD